MYDLIIIGGGPAGTAAAITAARHHASVLVLEKGCFPRHKVCGEFVSAESLSLLESLLSPDKSLLTSASRLAHARIFINGRQLQVPVTPPAASISRFDLDLALWRAAQAAGVQARQQSPVRHLSGDGPFLIQTAQQEYQARSVIDASGRWSGLRPHPAVAAQDKWIGIKAHYGEASPPPSVDLYFFDGGYCGVQPISRDRINVSAMVRASVATSLPIAFRLNQELEARSRAWQLITDPVATFPLIFGQPQPLRHHVLLAGDAAGFIDPFVGDGIALGLRTGTAAAECLIPFWRKAVPLAAACDSYFQLYRRFFLPLFRNARRFRRLLNLPSALRAPIAHLLEHTGLPGFVVRSTRGAMR
ncbi:MAG TPA: NAD(P)/FAD-dependent oxidoreductase [Terriglobales bacterium]|nr:NAD(P)/FAD-dependent oxidoreductase [Terriglobales bacterium]